MLAYFGAPIKTSIDQRREFFREFKTLYIKALIDHYITSRNHLKVDDFTKQIVYTVKCDL